MIRILEKYLHLNNYFRIAHEDLKLQLLSHPDYPSLKSLTDTLDYFHIDNIAVNVPADTLSELPDRFVTVINHPGSDNHVMVTKNHSGNISLRFENGRKKVLSENEFKDLWTGDTVLVEPAADKKNMSVKSSVLLLLAGLAVFLLLQIDSFNPSSFILSVLSLSGLFLSYLIINEEIGIHHQAVVKVCRAVNKDSNCADVIKAIDSKLLGIIALSDLSIVFFAFCFLTFSLVGINYTFWACVAILTIPVIAFSFYQQAVVIKNWCALCLGIAAILFLQGVVALASLEWEEIAFNYYLRSGLILILSATAWQWIKPMWISNLKLKNVETDFLKFKRNPDLFKALVHHTHKADNTIVPIEHQIYFGAERPVITINSVTNPLCGYCTESFKIHDQLLKAHGDRVRVNFIFSVPLNEKANSATHIASRIIEIYHQEGAEKAVQAMQTWFAHREIEKWHQQFGYADQSDTRLNVILNSHRNWCKENKISYTPATFIGDQLFPKEYQISDLLLLIDDLIAEQEAVSEVQLAVLEHLE